MNEEFDAVERAIWEETYGQYYDEDDVWHDDSDWDDDYDFEEAYEGGHGAYEVGYQDGYQAGMDAARQESLLARLKAFMVRWWVNRRMRAYAQDIDDIPF